MYIYIYIYNNEGGIIVYISPIHIRYGIYYIMYYQFLPKEFVYF